MARLLGVLLLLGVSWPLHRSYEAREVADGMWSGICVLLVLGIAFTGSTSIAFEQGRFRGVFENANLLGFVSGLLLFLATVRQGGWTKFVMVIVAIASLLASASRSSALVFFGLIVLLGFFADNRFAVRFSLGFTVTAAAIAAFYPSILFGHDLFRAGNSRMPSMEIAQLVLSDSPLFGYGFTRGGEVILGNVVAGSAFSFAIIGGLLGLTFLAATFYTMLLSSWRLSTTTGCFAIALIAYSFSEAWLLTMSGPTTLLAMMAWLAIETGEKRTRSRARRTEPQFRSVQRRLRHSVRPEIPGARYGDRRGSATV
ncbi:hypothetical protein [Janibacter hoylei]|uniref:hypothetical protein n=1 Tax=Janibacter hoylei TaxID=364298 RepID=UPI0012EACE62|nr:hypothetical protein [Janibacter hoylei]